MRNNLDLWIVLLLFLILSTLSIYLAFYTHATGDDYCHALPFKTVSGWYDYARILWSEWSGRWSASILRYFYYELIGLDGRRYWSVVIIALCAVIAGFLFATRTLYGAGRAALIWALLCTVIFIALASAIDALLFWMTGLTDYTMGYLFTPLALWMAAGVLASPQRIPWWSLLTAGIALFWACGFSEFFLLPVWLFLGCSLFVATNKRHVLFLGSFALAGTLLSVLAPGNLHRAEAQTLDLGLMEIAWGTLFYGFRGLLLPVFALALLSSLPFVARTVIELTSRVQGSLNDKLILAIAAFAVFYPFAIEFALFWNLGAPGPGRAHNISLFVLILSWPVILAAVKQKFSRPFPTLPRYGKIVLQLMAIVLLVSVNPYKMLRTIATGSSAQYHLDVSHAEEILMLSENHDKDIILPTDDLVTHDKYHWVNKCVAEYFSVNTVRAADRKSGPQQRPGL